jgi:hypothetical protein
MWIIILFFLNLLSVVGCFPTTKVTSKHLFYLTKSDTFYTTDENENIINKEIHFDGSSNNLETTQIKEEESLVNILVSSNLKRMNQLYGAGFDQREMEKTCLEKMRDEIEEGKNVMKLIKFIRQMNLLKKLENSQVSQFDKLKALDDYNNLMETIKYTHNFEAGGLYKDWNNNDFYTF